MDVVAIDFETANSRADSACQLAAVVVRDSQIVSEHSWLIRPPRMYFSPRNIAIHGIRPEDVDQAPTMEQVWSELCEIFDGQILVAHNARFDIGVLVASLSAFDVACPALQFTCTRMLARAAWPGRPGYGLKPLGDWLGVEFQHHDALEDARCCAHIALSVEQLHTPGDLSQLESHLQVSRGSYRHSRITSPRSLRGRGSSARGRVSSSSPTSDRWGFPNRRNRVGAVIPDEVVAAAAEQKPLAGKSIVLLGPLRGLDMQQSRELICRLGGHCQTNIDASTTYVVACGQSLVDAKQQLGLAQPSATPQAPATPQSSATATPTPQPSCVRVLSERQFRALLPGGKANASW